MIFSPAARRSLRQIRQRAEYAFGRPLPERAFDHPDLARVVPDWGDGLLVGTGPARAHPYLTAGDLARFLSTAPSGYFLMGFWGHGVNSHAFHFASAEMAGHIWLRLPYGGVYMDNRDTGTAIPDFLSTLFGFIDEVDRRGLNYCVLQNFSMGEARLDHPDGRSWQTRGNFLFYPSFRQDLAAALDDGDHQ